ncbi:MAG: DUF3305 domain-containing protein [Gammaproteobacteria bacterium]|nr:DUF3305 domain-containing protein [Gammaproteobacteria bacterium]
MGDIHLEDFNQSLAQQKTVSVVMEKRATDNAWIDYSYRAIGVVVGELGQQKQVKSIFQDGEVEHFLVTGLNLGLFEDECESYYHNLMSPKPGCFIVADAPDDLDEMPVPYLVSLSFDEVHAYLEGDEQVYAVEIPAELYQWAEAYVLTHYVATKKTKRKLKNWKEEGSSAGSVAQKPL